MSIINENTSCRWFFSFYAFPVSHLFFSFFPKFVFIPKKMRKFRFLYLRNDCWLFSFLLFTFVNTQPAFQCLFTIIQLIISPSTKLSVCNAVIFSTLTEELVGYSGEWSKCLFIFSTCWWRTAELPPGRTDG